MADPDTTTPSSTDTPATTPTGAGTGTTLTAGPAPQDPTQTGGTTGVGNAVPSADTGQGSNAKPAEDSSDEYGGKEGEDLYTTIAKLAPFGELGPTLTESKDYIKVGCYIVDRMNINKANTTYLKYGTDVISITINQGLSEFGTTANVIVRDIRGNLTSLLKHQMNFYFVIAVMTLFDENASSGTIVYQPYIFEVDSIKLMEETNDNKIYNIVLSDLVSATLKKVSYGNLLLQYPELPNAANFGDLYNYFIEYASTIINIIHDKKYKIPNKIIFKSLNSDSINAIIKGLIFKDLPIDTNAFVLLNKIYKIAAKELEAPESFAAKAEIKGTILTPLFLTEEWEDFSAAYRNFYETDTEIKFNEQIAYDGPYKCGGLYLKRGFFMKHLQMPFQLAFDKDQEPQIFEIINPKYERGKLSEEDRFFNPMNGHMSSPLNTIIELPIDGAVAGLGWRNLMLMADTPSGGSNSLIYFNWIYEYFKHAYLNYEECSLAVKKNKRVMPVMDPNFHVAEVNGLTGGDAEFFAKANSSVIKLRTEDIIKEAFLYVGRQVKSYIFMNALTGFKLNGSILRHPGEIIKINNPTEIEGIDTSQSLVGGIDAQKAGYTLLYLTHISHFFNGNKYEDAIYGTRICDVVDPEEVPQPSTNNTQTGTSTSTSTSTPTSTSTSTPSTNTTSPSNTTPTPSQ